MTPIPTGFSGRLLRQHGVVTRPQLIAAGFSARQVEYRLQAGSLARVYTGVYRVAWMPLTLRAREMAAVLAGGQGSVLSHRSAGAFWGLCDPPEIPEILRGIGGKPPPEIRIRRTYSLTREEWILADLLPVTTVARTLLDLAAVLDEDGLAAAYAAADRAGKTRHAAISQVLSVPSRPGAPALRRLHADHDPNQLPTRSEFERWARTRMRRHGQIELPEMNVIVEGREVDMLWRRQRLMVELDGRRHHEGDSKFDADRSRDLTMGVAGYRVLRISWRMFKADPDGVIDQLARILGDL